MTLFNATPFETQAVPTIGPAGDRLVVVVVKATFARTADSGELEIADDQAPIRAGDIPHFPDAPDSSAKYAADTAVAKKGSDVVVIGDAVARQPSPVVDVVVQVGERKVPLRVHGERVYYRAISGIAVGPAAAFTRKPIVYERAYGGSDGPLVERRNPVGRGVARSPSSLVDTPAPQIEHPAEPIRSASDRPAPVGYGAVPAHWSPRLERAGTFDHAWRATRMPLLPLDYDVRHGNVAHPSLQFDAHLRAGTPFAILNMTGDGLWQFALPEVRIRVNGHRDDGRVLVARPPIDTVLVEPTLGRVEITVRHALPLGRGKTLLRELRVDQDD